MAKKVKPIDRLIDMSRQVRSADLINGAEILSKVTTEEAIEMLSRINAYRSIELINLLSKEKRDNILDAAPDNLKNQWQLDRKYPKDTVGSLMEIPHALFDPDSTVEDAVRRLKEMTKFIFVNYGYLIDDEGMLQGLFAFRELLFAEPGSLLKDISIMDPYALTDTMSLSDAMQEVVTRHYPAYPVCNSEGKLIGILRGHVLFEAQAFEISAQAGAMQGVDKEERLSTPLLRSLRFRHPWLQLNLLTAFIAAAVVSIFQDTLDQIIVLAAFLPVLAGQSGNTGCQSLAVTLRGMTLGELKNNSVIRLIMKECLLGLTNGAIVGLIAGGGMWYYAQSQGNTGAFNLALIVWIAMFIACMVSGISGAVIPLALKKLGADPATASSIFLTTMTDVVSMGVFLGLATLTL